MLEKHFSVREFHFTGTGGWGLLGSFFTQFVFLLRNAWGAKVMISEFAGYQSFLPGIWSKLTGKRLLIISAGTDAASYPSINYGNYRKAVYRWFTQTSFRLCAHITPVHATLIRSENHFYSKDGIKQGIFEHVPGLDKPFTVIPYGYDSSRWPIEERNPLANSFITVAYIPDQVRYILKGIDLILDAAERLPDCQFTLVGMQYQPDRTIPSNVKVLGKVENKDLPDYYNRHEFYFQLSISEGHPNALCEAMLCRCIPIGSAVTSIPDIIGETGFTVPERTAEAVVAAIEKGLAANRTELATAARHRIETLFPFSRREQELKALTEQLEN